MRLIIIGEGPLDKELDLDEYFRLPGYSEGVPYTEIVRIMYYGRRIVPNYWGLVLNYDDGRKFLTKPSGRLTREKIRGLQGIYWLPEDHLASLHSEPMDLAVQPDGSEDQVSVPLHPSTHNYDDGICTICGCSKEAVEAFGFSCKRQQKNKTRMDFLFHFNPPVIYSSAIKGTHNFVDGVCVICGCSKLAVDAFGFSCKGHI